MSSPTFPFACSPSLPKERPNEENLRLSLIAEELQNNDPDSMTIVKNILESSPRLCEHNPFLNEIFYFFQTPILPGSLPERERRILGLCQEIFSKLFLPVSGR